MPDLEDYLLSGVLGGNHFGIEIPFEPFDLEVAALEMADEIIDTWRRKDRDFDAACGASFVGLSGWTWWHVPFEDLRVGQSIRAIAEKRHGGRIAAGEIAKIEPDRGYGARVTLKGQQYGFSSLDWDEDAYTVVPVPVDLSSLCLYPHPTGSVQGDAKLLQNSEPMDSGQS